jgi:hypothetical protein
MKRAFLACLILLIASTVHARCGVSCFVQTPVAVAVGIPVAEFSPTSYYWSPPPQVVVNVPPAPTIDYNALGQAVGQSVYAAINQANNQPIPTLPNAPQTGQQTTPQGPPPMPPPPSDPIQPQPTPAPIVPPQPTPAPPANVPQPIPRAAGIQFNEASCVKCHAGQSAKATAAIDMRQPLTAEQRLACTKALIQGTMPKGAPLSDPQQAAKIILELTGP